MKLSYDVRPADPLFRREHPDATEVVIFADGRAQRVLGVWKTEAAAIGVAAGLNHMAGEQIR